MRKTKIICTLGPATDKGNVLEQLRLSGMNVARLNFSHDTYENQKKRIDKVKALRTKHHLPVACLLDTKGPEIRLKTFKEERVTLEMGQDFCLTTRDVEGTKAVSYTHLDVYKRQHLNRQWAAWLKTALLLMLPVHSVTYQCQLFLVLSLLSLLPSGYFQFSL